MQLHTRKLLDKVFSSFGVFSILIMAAAVLILIVPIFAKGIGAFYFDGTIEFRKFLSYEFNRGNAEKLEKEVAESEIPRIEVFKRLRQFKEEFEAGKYDEHPEYDNFEYYLDEINEYVVGLLGPEPLSVSRVYEYNRFDQLRSEYDISEFNNLKEKLFSIKDDAVTPEHKDLYDGLRKHVVLFESLITRDPQELENFEVTNKVAVSASKLVKNILDHFDMVISSNDYSEFYSEVYDVTDQFKTILLDISYPLLTDHEMVTISEKYGRTRWDEVAEKKLRLVICREEVTYDDNGDYHVSYPSREIDFKGTSLEGLFNFFENNIKKMMLPRKTVYLRFLFDKPINSHMLGGIWPEVLGTLYLTFGAMIFAVPLGVIAAIYLTEFAPQNRVITVLRSFINTLAGVPSIVFGLFGLAFFINTIGVSPNKSVIAGSMTLSILILPTIIRASEEAIRSVPKTYKEAALSLGATKLWTVITVILPSALPGILTGIVISMGRAAGETAPIIFTAAVSVGQALKLNEVFSNGTPALSWNIYNLASEHHKVDEIRHVQFGMVLTLITLVILLNLAAIIIRARVSKNLKQ